VALARPAAATTLEDVVGRYLGWLAATDNYRVEIRTISTRQSANIGTVCVDNTTSPPTVRFDGEFQLRTGARSHPLVIAGNPNTAQAAVEHRATAWSLPPGPFNRSYVLIERGMNVDDAVSRLHQTSLKVTVLDNPHGGLTGIQMISNPDFQKKMEGLLEQVLLGGTLTAPGNTTVWFNGDGRLERMVINEGSPDAIVTALTYLDQNMPKEQLQSFMRGVDMQTKSQIYPSFLEMLMAVYQEDAAAQEPKP
jgi:hypothetical protein